MVKRLQPKSQRALWLLAALLLLAVAAMWSLSRCTSPRAEASAPSMVRAEGDTLMVAIEYGPMAVYLYDDTLGGFNYDLLRQLASACSIPMRIEPMVSLELSLKALSDSAIDLVVADLPSTLDYSDRFDFTEPAYLDKLVLVQLTDSAGQKPVETQLDIAGQTVWYPAGSPAEIRLRNLAAEIGDTIVLRPVGDRSSEQLVMMVLSGEIPLAVVNARSAESFLADNPRLDISTAVSFTQFQSYLLRRGDPLKARLDTALLRFKRTPAYRRLLSRYLPS